MNEKTLRALSSITLLVWGGVLLFFSLSGRIHSFLHPNFRPGAMIAGFALVILAGTYLWATSKSRRHATDCCGHDHKDDSSGPCSPGLGKSPGCCGHDHAGQAAGSRVFSFLILLLPMIAAVVASPDAFGLSTMRNRGIITDLAGLGGAGPSRSGDYLPMPGQGADGVFGDPQASVSDYLPRNAKGHIRAEVVDLIFGTDDEVIRKDFEGNVIEVTGQMFTATENNPGGTRFKLVRMFMMCCAADARPVAIFVENQPGAEVREMGWVKVTGKASFPVASGQRIVVIEATTIEPVEKPEDSMLY